MSGSHVDPVLREYVLQRFATEETKLLQRMRPRAEAAGLPQIQVEPEQARLLAILVRMAKAERVLDIGTLFGYSAAAMALASPDVRVTSLEYDPRHAEVARQNLHELGLDGRVDVLVGDAKLTIQDLEPPFDLALIDADKTGYDTYYEHCLRLVRKDGLVLVDNVFAFGKVATRSQEEDVKAVQAFNEKVSRDSRVQCTILPVGDGLLLARVLGNPGA